MGLTQNPRLAPQQNILTSSGPQQKRRLSQEAKNDQSLQLFACPRPAALVCLLVFGGSLVFFSRKHGEGFFRWIHGSHCKELSSSESLHRVIIIMRVIAKSYHHWSHCTESSSSEPLQRVIIIRIIAKSHHHQSHCAESSSS